MLVIRHARVATMTGSQAADGFGPLGLIEDGAVACDGERIAWVGPSAQAPAGDGIDAGGKLLMPGFVDPHTHLVFGGDRAREHAMRLAGATYLQIAQAGGGIRSTVAATRAASDEELLASARRRLRRMAASGVTTVEVKTGYGLTVRDELRLLRIARSLSNGDSCEVIPTLLALHAVPAGVERTDWVAQVIDELTPQAAHEGARFCDAFLEQGAFPPAECRAALEAGVRAGLVPRLHADQLSDGGGARLAAELRCSSADHLEHASQQGIQAMAKAGTAAVMLPLAACFLRQKAAQAAPFLAAGVAIALGSNLNPGSQPIESVSMLLAAACMFSGLAPAQALWAFTAGGARALKLDDRGVIAPGKLADLVLFSTSDPDHLPYHGGIEHAAHVIFRGRPRQLPAPDCAG